MAETMVEKVAKAIALDRAEPWDSLNEDERISFRETARAAIGEMREPTEEMKKAGAFRYRDIPLGNGTSVQGMALGDDPINSYRKMIDAALKEE